MLIKEDLTLGSTNLDRRERQARSDRAHRSTDPWWVAVQRRRHTPPRVPPNSRGPCWGTAALDRIFCRVLASLSVRRASTSRPDAVRPHPVAEAAEAACRRWVFPLLHIYIFTYFLRGYCYIQSLSLSLVTRHLRALSREKGLPSLFPFFSIPRLLFSPLFLVRARNLEIWWI